METNEINNVVLGDLDVVPSSVQSMEFDLDNDSNKHLGFLPSTSDESIDNGIQNLLSDIMSDNGGENNSQPDTMLDDIDNNSAEENDNFSTSDNPSEYDTVNFNTEEWPLGQINDDQHAVNDLDNDLSTDLDNLQNNMGSADDLVHILNKWTQNFHDIHVNQFRQPTGVNFQIDLILQLLHPLITFSCTFLMKFLKRSSQIQTNL